MQKKNPSRSEKVHLKNVTDGDSQNTAINTSPLNRYNFFVKHLLQAPVNAVLFLIARYSLKICEAFENNFFFLHSIREVRISSNENFQKPHNFCLELPKGFPVVFANNPSRKRL